MNLFVEGLSHGARVTTARLSEESQRVVDLRLTGLTGTGALLQQTSLVLASLSSGVGLAVAGAVMVEEREHVYVSRLATGRVLAVVVTRAGSVRDRLLQLPRDFSTRELEMASAFLNERFRGWGMEQIRAELARLVEQQRSEYQAMLTTVGELWSQALPVSEPPVVHVGGVGNLLRAGAGRDADGSRLREVMAALEAKELVAELLTAYLDSWGSGVRGGHGATRTGARRPGARRGPSPTRWRAADGSRGRDWLNPDGLRDNDERGALCG